MIINKIDKDLPDFNVTDILSPFGPLMMKGSLKEPIRKKTLSDIKKILDNDEPSDKVIHGAYGEGQDATINAGKFKALDGNHSDIIQLIHNLCSEYYSCICFNVAQERPEIWDKLEKSNRIITSMWCVLMKEGDFHISHNHTMEGAMVSGGIYLDVPEHIKSPLGDINWNMSLPGIDFRSDIYKHSPKNGDWVIWPAWLQHHVYPFRGEGERIMISFNARLDPKDDQDYDK